MTHQEHYVYFRALHLCGVPASVRLDVVLAMRKHTGLDSWI